MLTYQNMVDCRVLNGSALFISSQRSEFHWWIGFGGKVVVLAGRGISKAAASGDVILCRRPLPSNIPRDLVVAFGLRIPRAVPWVRFPRVAF